jgi:hypothetical protein
MDNRSAENAAIGFRDTPGAIVSINPGTNRLRRFGSVFSGSILKASSFKQEGKLCFILVQFDT